MTLTALQTQPALIDQVHDRLLGAIIDGTLAPGLRLTQDSIAEMLGVSRQPVSHAIQVLRRRGLLVDAGKRGVSVAPIDGARIRNLYQVRSALDGLAAELAAKRCGAGICPKTDMMALKACVENGARTVEVAAPDLMTLVDADVAFHTKLYVMSGNAAIPETVAEQWPHFRRSMRTVLDGEGMIRRVWLEHARIAEAVMLGRAEEAGTFAREHAARSAEATARRLDALGRVA